MTGPTPAEAAPARSVVRVLLVDDHPTFRSGLRAILTTDPVLHVVGEAADGEAAVAAADEFVPDLVVMDLAMPGMDGVEATRRVASAHPEVRILVLTMSDADASVFAALRAGAHGYLLKDADPDEILTTLRAVADGRAVFGPRVAARVLAYFGSGAASGARPFPELSERERDVLELLARGRDNATIARTLVLSPKTVRNHVSNVISKVHAADRAQAIVKAREAGFGRGAG